MAKLWKPEDIDALRKLWLEGASAEEIAARLGLTVLAVKGKASRLCLERRREPLRLVPAFLIAPEPMARDRTNEGAGAPPITLHHDDELVSACLSQGGFPRAVRTSLGTVWASHDNKPWRVAA